MDDAALQLKLEEVAEVSNRLRFRITMSTVVLGFIVCIFCIFMWMSLEFRLLDTKTFGLESSWYIMLTPVGVSMLIGVMPNDVITIRFLALAFVGAFCAAGVGLIAWSAYEWFALHGWDRNYDGGPTDYPCGKDLPSLGCGLHAIDLFVRSLFTISEAYILWPILVKVEGGTIYDSKQQKGFRYKDSAFKMAARVALDREWFVLRSWAFVMGIMGIVMAIPLHLAGDRAPFYTNQRFANDLVDGVLKLSIVAIFSDDRRKWIQASLNSMNAEGQAASAACVAALLGGRNSTTSLEVAKGKFRSLPFGALEEKDFTSSKPSREDANALYDKTSATKLGSCDAFISHSWSDDGKKKYNALCEWAKDFGMKNGRDPEVWFDKACIDQNSDIANDILCLPIFLAGCETLLIIAGPTYTSRLWCVIEVFVFLKMGGSIERITVIPIDWEDERAARSMFDKVDIGNAQCHVESERQKLLGIVEQGFGDFSSFNQIIRHVFGERMSVKITFEEWETNLQEVAQQSQRLRSKIRMRTTGVGSVLFCACIIMGQLIGWEALDESTFGSSMYYYSWISPLACIMLFGVTPNDVKTIRGLTLFFVILLTFFGFLAFRSAYIWDSRRHVLISTYVDIEEEPDAPRYCGRDVPGSWCTVRVAYSTIAGVLYAVCAWTEHKSLLRFKDALWYDRNERDGFKYRDCAFKTPPREALNRLWFVARYWSLGFAFLTVVPNVLWYLLGADWYDRSRVERTSLMSGCFLATFAFFTEDRRRQIMAFLSSMHGEDSELSAACVGALLGGHNVRDSLALAKQNFRSVSFTDLEAKDLGDSTQNQSPEERYMPLREESIPAELGQCDFFISHSWSDDPQEKYNALKEYVLKFKAKNKRDPKIWLDTACIGRTDISQDLVCLPIYLAGCDRLVILAGPTYTERLWCIIELFVFLKMGGSIDLVTLLPIGSLDESTAKSNFNRVDVNTSKCSVEIDRQKLLGVVEEGFGDFQAFNEIIHSIFQDSSQRSSDGDVGARRMSLSIVGANNLGGTRSAATFRTFRSGSIVAHGSEYYFTSTENKQKSKLSRVQVSVELIFSDHLFLFVVVIMRNDSFVKNDSFFRIPSRRSSLNEATTGHTVEPARSRNQSDNTASIGQSLIQVRPGTTVIPVDDGSQEGHSTSPKNSFRVGNVLQDTRNSIVLVGSARQQSSSNRIIPVNANPDEFVSRDSAKINSDRSRSGRDLESGRSMVSFDLDRNTVNGVPVSRSSNKNTSSIIDVHDQEDEIVPVRSSKKKSFGLNINAMDDYSDFDITSANNPMNQPTVSGVGRKADGRRATLTLDDASLQLKLEEAAEVSNRLRFRITMSTVVLGFVCTSVVLFLWAFTEFRVLEEQTFGHDSVWNALMQPFSCLMLIGVMPNDVILIRFLSAMFVPVFISSGLICISWGFYEWFVLQGFQRNYEGGSTVYPCGEDLPSLGCGLYCTDLILRGTAAVALSSILCPILQKREGARIYDPNQQKGFRYRDSAFKIPGRKALDRGWRCVRMFALSFSVLDCVSVLMMALAKQLGDNRAPYYQSKHFTHDVLSGILRLSIFFFFADDRRRWIQANLTTMNTEGQAASAACVAALLGGRNASTSLDVAKGKFRSLPFSALKEKDFTSSKHGKDEANALYDKTSIAKLGSCDVFISHSWSDNGKKKYAALCEWAKEFEIKNGREPEVWLDKACIDQNSDIANDILCLPIFLAGCETLLIIAGPTYTSRLWCIIEVFVFLKMGGSIERILVIPIDWEDEREARTMFDKVDVGNSQCHLESDRQKLLGIVEQGFGDFSSFNQIIRHVFGERMSVQITFEEWESNLEEVAKKSQRLSYQIRMRTTGAGCVAFCATVTMALLIANGALDRNTFGRPGYYNAFVAPLTFYMLLGILPNDAKVVRGMSAFCAFCLTGMGLLQIFLVYVMNSQRDVPTDHDFEGDRDTQIWCAADLPNNELVCTIGIAWYSVFGCFLVMNGFIIQKNLSWFKGAKWYDRHEREGFKYKDDAFKEPTRVALNRFWFVGRLYAFGSVLINLTFTLMMYGAGTYFVTVEFIKVNLFIAFTYCSSAAFFTEDRRHRILSFLSSIGEEDHAMSAATVGALLGGHNVNDSLSLAKERFRSVSLSDLEARDLGNSTDNQTTRSQGNESMPTELGQCDIFVSHSWSDNPQERYDALQDYVVRFRTDYKRDPKLWLDTACIDQTDISQDLVCLPIYLAGCDKFVILAGPTYTERLWCIIEMFVFLKMGGSIDRVTILPIGSLDEAAVKKQFDEVDANTSKCSLESDRQKLLGIVEQGFGDCQAFNEIIQNVFKERKSRKGSYINHSSKTGRTVS